MYVYYKMALRLVLLTLSFIFIFIVLMRVLIKEENDQASLIIEHYQPPQAARDFEYMGEIPPYRMAFINKDNRQIGVGLEAPYEVLS